MLPPSFEILERRLRGRSADSEAAMQKRLAAARAEAGCYVDYDYVVINDQLEPTVVRLQEIIAAERSRMHRMSPVAEDIIKTFRLRSRIKDKESKFKMALIALGVMRRNRGLQGRRDRARAAEERPRRGGRDDEGLPGSSSAPLTFEAITRRQVITDQWQPGANADIEHIAIASNIDLLRRGAGHREHHRQVRQRPRG